MRDGNEGPSCVWLPGDLQDASLEELERCYTQARDSYFSGKPVVDDEMYDRVEMLLREKGSTLSVKFPRCSLSKFDAYSDAQNDPSLLNNLWQLWGGLLATGIVLGLNGLHIGLDALLSAGQDLLHEGRITQQASNAPLTVALSVVFAAPLVSTSVKVLKRLKAGNFITLKGSCPHCGEEVYQIIEEEPGPSVLKQSGTPSEEGVRTRAKQRGECHVCDGALSFHAFVHRRPVETADGKGWSYGRIYAKKSADDMSP